MNARYPVSEFTNQFRWGYSSEFTMSSQKRRPALQKWDCERRCFCGNRRGICTSMTWVRALQSRFNVGSWAPYDVCEPWAENDAHCCYIINVSKQWNKSKNLWSIYLLNSKDEIENSCRVMQRKPQLKKCENVLNVKWVRILQQRVENMQQRI